MMAQILTLKIFGFITQSPVNNSTQSRWHPTLRKILTALQVLSRCVMILATSGVFLMEFSTSVFRAVHRQPHDSHDDFREPFLIYVIRSLSYCFYSGRAVLILSIFLHQQPAWHELQISLWNLLTLTGFICMEAVPKIIRHARRLSVTLFFTSIVLHYAYVMGTWRSALNLGNVYGNQTVTEWCYFGTCLAALHAMALRTVTFDLSFVFSQQVIIVAVIFAVVIARVMDTLDKDIQIVVSQCRNCVNPVPLTTQHWLNLKNRVALWSALYISMIKVINQLNAIFGGILILSVASDLLTALGNGASLVTPGADLSLAEQMFYLSVCGLFTGYTTVLFVPFVMTFDKVRRTVGNIFVSVPYDLFF